MTMFLKTIFYRDLSIQIPCLAKILWTYNNVDSGRPSLHTCGSILMTEWEQRMVRISSFKVFLIIVYITNSLSLHCKPVSMKYTRTPTSTRKRRRKTIGCARYQSRNRNFHFLHRSQFFLSILCLENVLRAIILIYCSLFHVTCRRSIARGGKSTETLNRQ